MSLFADGMAMLNRVLPQVNPCSIAWTKASNGASITINGWTGSTKFESEERQGLRVEFGDIDLLFPVSACTTGEPATGDRAIVTLANGVTYTFEVRPIAGEPAWRYSDQNRNTYRVHMKRV
jgi:hypothetical protein